jgi:hypothetical protein
MADNKLHIPSKLKIETHKQLAQLKVWTNMNSDAPWDESAVRTSLIPLHGRTNFTNTSSWAKELGAIVLPTLKNWWGQNSFASFFGNKLRIKKTVLLTLPVDIISVYIYLYRYINKLGICNLLSAIIYLSCYTCISIFISYIVIKVIYWPF